MPSPSNTRRSAALEQIERTIEQVRRGETSNARTDAAERLAELTRKIDPGKVDDQTLSELISLLDTWEDSVRDAVAISIGNLGPRAREAAPELLKILPEVECLWVESSSASDVREALKLIGTTPPPPATCETTVDPVVWKERIAKAIETIRTGETPVVRAKAAMRLSYLTFWFAPKRVIDQSTIASMVSLLDLPDEPVREGVAAALGHFGARASIAVPKLQTLLRESDCRNADSDLREVIKGALNEMGAKPQSVNCEAQGKNVCKPLRGTVGVGVMRATCFIFVPMIVLSMATAQFKDDSRTVLHNSYSNLNLGFRYIPPSGMRDQTKLLEAQIQEEEKASGTTYDHIALLAMFSGSSGNDLNWRSLSIETLSRSAISDPDDASAEAKMSAWLAHSEDANPTLNTSKVVSGQRFSVSVFALQDGPIRKGAVVWTTVRKGKFLSFFFAANSPEQLKALAETMKTVQFF
jgi:hypothetical protein